MSTVKSISKTAIYSLKPGESLRDKDCPGLRVKANKNGSTSWCYLRRAGDRQIIKKTLGSTATFSIAEARDWAREFNAVTERGGNPNQAVLEDEHAVAVERARLWEQEIIRIAIEEGIAAKLDIPIVRS